MAADGKLMAVPVTITGTKFDSGVPQPLGGQPLAGGPRDFGYQPSADGQKFLALVRAEGKAAAPWPVTVWMNWQAGLKK